MNVLIVDPELGASISEDERAVAVQRARAPLFRFPRGLWNFFPDADPAAVGALMLKGMIVVRIDVGVRAHVELMGPADVISPWVGMGPEMTFPSAVSATVLADTQIALLDRSFAYRTARWPEIHAALLQRLIMRSRRLGLQSAINAIPHVHERIELTLWQLAQRFGRVTKEGVTLDLPLSHTQLADMTGAQRPSVSVAIGRLERERRLARTARRQWILFSEPPPPLAPLQRLAGLHP